MPDSPKPKQRSTERHGTGQSGYTGGRKTGDPSIEENIADRNASYPDEGDDKPGELGGEDDRFRGRGGRPWAPSKP